MNERRKSDRRIPPSVAQHAIEERAELLARIEGLVSKNDTLNRTNLELCDQLHSALKAQPSGAVLPEPFDMRPFQTVDQGSTNFKAGFNAALRKVRERLNSPTASAGDDMCNAENPDSRCVCREEFGYRACVKSVSAGVVDESEAFNAWWDTSPMGDSVDPSDQSQRYIALQTWQARAALTAQPDHSAQSINMVPDGYALVPVEPTPSMRAAIMSGISHDHMVGNYKAMLAAAPKPAAADVGGLVEAIQAAVNAVIVPVTMSNAKAEYYKAGARHIVAKVNAALAAYKAQGGDV